MDNFLRYVLAAGLGAAGYAWYKQNQEEIIWNDLHDFRPPGELLHQDYRSKRFFRVLKYLIYLLFKKYNLVPFQYP